MENIKNSINKLGIYKEFEKIKEDGKKVFIKLKNKLINNRFITVAGILFARALVRPINRITKAAQALKEGNYSTRTGMDGNDEISRLGNTFDLMADSIEANRKLERRLITDVAHELRTPLMAIQSTVEAMIDGVFDSSPERLETLNSEVRRLSRLVDALLKLSRLENRSTPIERKKVDLTELLSTIVETHKAYVNDAGLNLEFNSGEIVGLHSGNADNLARFGAEIELFLQQRYGFIEIGKRRDAVEIGKVYIFVPCCRDACFYQNMT